MPRAYFRYALVAAMVFLSMLAQETWALAGTTGALTGTVYEAGTTQPLADAQVTASSPSQSVSTKTDASGHFAFVSLAPDTYTVSVAKDGYEPTSQSGQSVFADQTQTLTLGVQKKLKEIGNVTSRAVGDLVKSGTTSDVYSVNAAQSDRVAALGGGGGLNNAYSAIASVPGVYVPMNQNGYYQTVHIRGGDYDQVGYELDGVPVNRSFDNYPAGTASSLGQQELQVYTGASPANSEGQGLAGYINQVIRTGTYPGFGTFDIGVGGPAFYHKLAAEAGGATPNRNFSYYIGVGGYNNDASRYIDPYNGSAYTQQYGNVIGFDPTGQAVFAGPNSYLESGIADRDVVANLHIGIPHRRDSGKDDVQLLVDSQFLKTEFYDSTNDIGQNIYQTIGNGLPAYTDSAVYTGSVGAPLPSNFGSMFTPYYFPNSPSNRCINVAGFGALSCTSPALIPFDARDTIYNDQEIVKLQYQKNLSSNAYFRIYGYSYYSDWLQNGPQTAVSSFFGPSGPDYELITHTRGLSASFADQLSAQHLLDVQASYSTASTVRNNNGTMFNTGSAAIVGSANPNSGICYDVTGAPQSCSGNGAPAPLLPGTSLPPIAPGATCGGSACEYYAVENGLNGTYNTVVPKFTSASITDQYKPNDKLLINFGLRWDQFQFQGASTTGGARDFWFNEFNQNSCINPLTGVPIDKSLIGTGFSPLTACTAIPLPGGGFYATPNLQNISAPTFTYNVYQPRLAATYTMNPDTVLRGSFGRYAEPASAAYEQYNAQQQDLADFLANRFYQYGFTTPGHPIRPSISYNYDLSLEKHIKGTSWSYKLTPFYRKTQDQVENFFLNQQTGFVSGFNVGRLTAKGVELQVNGGDFSKNGLAGQLAFTYTNAYVNYSALPNGSTVVSGINQDIKNYNAYTAFCASNLTDGRCSGGATNSGVGAAPCYTTGGTPAPTCPGGSVANPYWNAPVQALLDPGANYVPYDIFPGGIGVSADSYNVPYVATLILNYKHNKLAITPSFQFAAGNRYGTPESIPGVAPDTCTATFGTTDPGRYPYGAPGGTGYEAGACGTLFAIPNPFTHSFDPPGSFRNPSQLLGNLQISYEVSPKVTLTATFANLINRCFGGQVTPFTYNTSSNICSYSTLYSSGSLVPPAGNIYDPCTAAPSTPCLAGGTVPVPQYQRFPYEPAFGPVNVDGNSTRQPFAFYLTAHIKM